MGTVYHWYIHRFKMIYCVAIFFFVSSCLGAPSEDFDEMGMGSDMADYMDYYGFGSEMDYYDDGLGSEMEDYFEGLGSEMDDYLNYEDYNEDIDDYVEEYEVEHYDLLRTLVEDRKDQQLQRQGKWRQMY